MNCAAKISLALILSLLPSSAPEPASAPVPASAPLPASAPVRGETLPKGPPWFTEYREARRHALRTGTPVFVYFTKTV